MYLNDLECPAAYKLLGYLEAVGDFIRTGEVKWYFAVRLVETIAYDESRVFEYFNPESDELLHGITGYFAVIILNEKLRRCLILSGSTSD